MSGTGWAGVYADQQAEERGGRRRDDDRAAFSVGSALAWQPTLVYPGEHGELWVEVAYIDPLPTGGDALRAARHSARQDVHRALPLGASRALTVEALNAAVALTAAELRRTLEDLAARQVEHR